MEGWVPSNTHLLRCSFVNEKALQVSKGVQNLTPFKPCKPVEVELVHSPSQNQS
jgi:hypothetical protein